MAFDIYIVDSDGLISKNKLQLPTQFSIYFILFCDCSVYWTCVLIASFIVMLVVLAYSLDDYFNDPVVINIEPTAAKKTSVFPAVSVCTSKFGQSKVNTERIEHFVKKHYAEHNIAEPQQYINFRLFIK